MITYYLGKSSLGWRITISWIYPFRMPPISFIREGYEIYTGASGFISKAVDFCFPHVITTSTTSYKIIGRTSKGSAFMVTYYEILGLPSSWNSTKNLTPQLLKAAYRKALLQHHPDKVQQVSSPEHDSTKATNNHAYTVDQITKAYSVISTPKLREEYDRDLALQCQQTGNLGAQQKDSFHTGVEVVDLDDLEFDQEESLWFRSCRCGDDRGFLIREDDLEEAADDGELAVGCKGCSLWLRVLFGVVEECVEKDLPGKGKD
jgi:diphthamide biosynthesis protein 4